MSVPNTITKVYNRAGHLVNYDISRISNAIRSAILDVEGCYIWFAEKRAAKYAQKITETIYNEFYNLQYNINYLIKLYISFEPEERYKRLFDRFCTTRIAVLLIKENYQKIKQTEQQNLKKVLDDIITEQVYEVIKNNNMDYIIKNDLEFKKLVCDKIISLIEDIDNVEYDFPKTEYILDVIEKYLINESEIDIAEGFMLYRESENKLRNKEITAAQFTNNGIHRQVCRQTIDWNIDYECENLFNLNKWMLNIDNKTPGKLVELSEARFKYDVLSTSSEIMKKIDNLKIIIIAGPSCSNKTTTTVIVNNELKKKGLKLKQFNVDDYYKDIVNQPKDEYGDFDFEMPESIDLQLLKKHLDLLLHGQTIQKPKFNFKKEKRDGYSEFKLEENEILLIDCLHGLYKDINGVIPQYLKYTIYIESMNILRDLQGHNIKWTDVRLLKRMIRDKKYRNYSTEKTLAHWPYVRKGELKHIIPYIHTTDKVLNAGLPYELPVLKKVLIDDFPDDEFIEALRKQKRFDPYIRAMRVKYLLETVIEFPNLDLIPADSPIREFIGGSSYVIPHNE